MQTNLHFFQEIKSFFERKNIFSARAEAEELIFYFGRMSREEFFAGDKKLSEGMKRDIRRAAQKRARGVPLQHLTGRAYFYGREFSVNREVLIPRPETEVLLEETLRRITSPETRILELGTGSGCLAISLTIEKPDCKMTALDISEKALKMARKNAGTHGIRKGYSRFLRSDLFSIFGKHFQGFWDVIVSNPPYIPSSELRTLPKEVRREPRLALSGGRQGLEIIRRIFKEAPYFLKPKGWLLIEIGGGQSDLIRRRREWLAPFSDWYFVKDLNRIERVLVARKNG